MINYEADFEVRRMGIEIKRLNLDAEELQHKINRIKKHSPSVVGIHSCRICNKRIPDDVNFCSHCGTIQIEIK